MITYKNFSLCEQDRECFMKHIKVLLIKYRYLIFQTAAACRRQSRNNNKKHTVKHLQTEKSLRSTIYYHLGFDDKEQWLFKILVIDIVSIKR